MKRLVLSLVFFFFDVITMLGSMLYVMEIFFTCPSCLNFMKRSGDFEIVF